MRRKTTQFVHADNYMAEVAVELIEGEDDWSPTLSSEDALKLDAVRAALKAGNIAEAKKYGRVFELLPVS